MDVGSWLRALGLGQYEAAFRDNAIDGAVLPKLTLDDLKEIGVAAVGHRRKMMSAIEALNAPFAAPVAADAAERRQLTVMFCDLIGSTALSARLDPEDMRQVIHAYQDACSGVLARYDGFVAKFFGDGILATFGFPRAHEDDAARAVHAGLDITEAVGRLQTHAHEKLAVRIGIATGLVVAGDIVGQGAAQEQVVVGDTPNLAARLQGLAEAGGVVVSAATRRLIGDRFRLKNLGRHAVKGLAEPVEAYAALSVSQSESRFEAAHSARLTGFVGREAESAELIARQRRAWGGDGQTVLISGEAGIGKSRLSAWLAEQVADTAHTRLRYQCSPYHRDSALHPFAQQFERAAGIAPQEQSEAKLDKLEKVLGLATEQMSVIVPLIASMLSIPLGKRYPPLTVSPALQRRLTLSALLDRMEGLAARKPLLILFEDAHWADATSLEVLDLVIERARRLPVFLLITFRPEFEAPWSAMPDIATVTLGRLDRVQAETLVERIAGGRKLPLGSARADRRQDRRGAALCRRVDEGRAGIGTSHRGAGPISPRRAFAAARDTLDAAGFADGATRPPRRREGDRADRRGDRTRIRLCLAERRRGSRRADAAVRARATGGLGTGFPPRRAARRALCVQTRFGAGHRLRKPAQEPAADPASEDRRYVARAIPRHRRGRA